MHLEKERKNNNLSNVDDCICHPPEQAHALEWMGNGGMNLSSPSVGFSYYVPLMECFTLLGVIIFLYNVAYFFIQLEKNKPSQGWKENWLCRTERVCVGL